MKFNVVDMFHSIILKHAANIAQNIMTYKNAFLAKNGFAIVIANMYHVTITNMFVEHLTAQLLLLSHVLNALSNVFVNV